VRFDGAVKERIASGQHDDLIAFERMGQDAALAINSAEHYLPLLYVLGSQLPGERVSFFNETVMSSISMTSVVVGAWRRRCATQWARRSDMLPNVNMNGAASD